MRRDQGLSVLGMSAREALIVLVVVLVLGC
jgi:hypothetical protein